MSLEQYTDISLYSDDFYSALKIKDIFMCLNSDETETYKNLIQFNGLNDSSSRLSLIVKMKISRLRDIVHSIYTEPSLVFDVIVIGAGISGLCCVNQILAQNKNKSILIITENIGGSLLMTKEFGMALLPHFIIETYPFLKSATNILTQYKVAVWQETALSIAHDANICTVTCGKHFARGKAVVVATGRLNKLYFDLRKHKNILDSIQIRRHKKYQEMIANKLIAIIGKEQAAIDYMIPFKKIIYLNSDTIQKDDFRFIDNQIYIISKNIVVDYLIFDQSAFSPNRIEGDTSSTGRIFHCGEVAGEHGVLNAIISGIDIGKKASKLGGHFNE